MRPGIEPPTSRMPGEGSTTTLPGRCELTLEEICSHRHEKSLHDGKGLSYWLILEAWYGALCFIPHRRKSLKHNY